MPSSGISLFIFKGIEAPEMPFVPEVPEMPPLAQ